MHHVRLELTDQLYRLAQHRASEAGFTSVDQYLSDVVSDNLTSEGKNLDFLFTPERIEELDRISAEIEAGAITSSSDDLREHFIKKRAEWLAKHPS